MFIGNLIGNISPIIIQLLDRQTFSHIYTHHLRQLDRWTPF